MSSFERGKAHLEALISSVPGTSDSFDENEATTRFRLIDKVLSDILDWPSEQVACEEHVNGDYMDYVLGSPEMRLVLEAKRTGIHFEMPAGISGRYVALATLRDHSEANRKAIDQVVGYCQQSGIGLAVLSNGHQFIGFIGSRSDGTRPSAGRAVVYAGLQDAVDNFNEFWDNFSLHGVERGELFRRLSSRKTFVPPPAPLSMRIHSYPGYRIGSAMETDLSILGDLFIQDVVREESVTEDFLAACYCSSGALSQYASVSKEILKTRYSILSQQVRTESAVGRRGVSPLLQEDLLAGAMTKRPIILLGDVGVGKSIFLKHFFRIDAKDLLKKEPVFYVDFLKHSGLMADVPSHIVKVISDALDTEQDIKITDGQFVRSVYNGEINAFKRGIFGALEQDDPSEFRRREIEMLSRHIDDEFEHVKRSLVFLQSSRGFAFVIVLDNVDQHQSAFQEQIFVAGQSLAETWPSAVFMSLRPDTFYESRKAGALAAYQPRVFTVSPPRSDQVVTKRLEFARKELLQFGRLPGFPVGLTLDSKSLLIYIDVLIDAFQTNGQLIELIDNLSSGNTRRALDFISTFVGSGYVQTSRILDADRTGRSYVVPLHEFLRAILYGDHKYYDPQTSPIPNLFAVHTNDSKEHFLLPLLLAFIQASGERQSGGFIDRHSVFASLQQLQYRPDQIAAHLERAEKANLIESGNIGDGDGLLRVTPAGGYMYKSLISNFAYLDAVVIDTPITDAGSRALIRDVQDIEDRAARAQAFVQYLDKCWPFTDESLPFFWPTARAESESAIAEVLAGAARASARRSK